MQDPEACVCRAFGAKKGALERRRGLGDRTRSNDERALRFIVARSICVLACLSPLCSYMATPVRDAASHLGLGGRNWR